MVHLYIIVGIVQWWWHNTRLSGHLYTWIQMPVSSIDSSSLQLSCPLPNIVISPHIRTLVPPACNLKSCICLHDLDPQQIPCIHLCAPSSAHNPHIHQLPHKLYSILHKLG